MKAALLAILWAAGCCAQLRIYAVGADGAEREAAGLYDMGSGGPGDVFETRFRVRNTGVAALAVQSFSVLGQGFSVTGPTLQYNVAPGLAADLRVRFTAAGTGSYSANLLVNSLSLLLRATVVAAPVLTVDGVDLPAGAPIDLGRAQKGQRTARALFLENRGRDPLSVRRIETTGSEAFRLVGPAAVVIPAAARQRIDIDFAPVAAGTFAGVLNIDGRAFPLLGAGFDPPLPKPSIRIEGTAASGRQPKLIVELASPPESAATGVLRMEFRPLGDLPDDPAIRFVAGGGRNLGAQVKPGDTRLWFGALNEAVFQAGTTAGTIVWTLELGPHIETQTAQLAPAAPMLDSTLALRKTQDLEITLAGFDNTRSISQALFTFFDASGRPVSPGTIRADIRREFDEFFRSSAGASGGIFTMRASFPVQGGAALQVTAVEAEIVNSTGGSRTQRMTFP